MKRLLHGGCALLCFGWGLVRIGLVIGTIVGGMLSGGPAVLAWLDLRPDSLVRIPLSLLVYLCVGGMAVCLGYAVGVLLFFTLVTQDQAPDDD
jgi:hypothetical protein